MTHYDATHGRFAVLGKPEPSVVVQLSAEGIMLSPTPNVPRRQFQIWIPIGAAPVGKLDPSTIRVNFAAEAIQATVVLVRLFYGKTVRYTSQQRSYSNTFTEVLDTPQPQYNGMGVCVVLDIVFENNVTSRMAIESAGVSWVAS
jgi:hypothetical protein